MEHYRRLSLKTLKGKAGDVLIVFLKFDHRYEDRDSDNSVGEAIVVRRL